MIEFGVEFAKNNPKMSNSTIPQPEIMQDDDNYVPTLKRKKTIAVPENNKFVIQLPVAQDVLQEAEFIDGEEFTHLSYTAVTSGKRVF